MRSHVLAALVLVAGCHSDPVQPDPPRAPSTSTSTSTSTGGSGPAPLPTVAVVAPHAAPKTVATDLRAVSLAVDDTSAYWVDDDRTIDAVELASGRRTKLATGDHPSTIAIGPTHVYWIDDPGASLVRRVPLRGGDVETVASPAHLKIWGLATDASNVYWADYFSIRVIPFAGQPSRTLSCSSGMMTIAVGPTHVACSGVLDKNIAATPLAGGPARVLGASDVPAPLAIDDRYAYWIGGAKPASPDAVVRGALDGSGTRDLVDDSPVQHAIAAADGQVVFARADGTIAWVSRAGGPSTTLAAPRADGKNTVVALVPRGRFVYAAVKDGSGAGAILRVER